MRSSGCLHAYFSFILMWQAVASEGGTDDAKRRGDAFAHAFSAHLARFSSQHVSRGKKKQFHTLFSYFSVCVYILSFSQSTSI